MNTTLFESGTTAAKWGASNFYEDEEEVLRKAVEGGEPFDTGWYSVKKEVTSARVYRENGRITAEVSQGIDELHDLFYDRDIDMGHLESLLCGEYQKYYESALHIPDTTDFDSVIALIDSAEEAAATYATSSIERMEEIIENYQKEADNE